ncbi:MULTISPECIES: SusD/RagB family nutrient-binding outer membrane lipoprotein [unclassified Carboxylicivirga]|uniref:SusD/RagB family nutrient-binding outer membrane lipoprotein n=1 Tax=Carboxylicivirga TaxID=1628153 RepID=UPI003D32D96A
MKLKLVNINNIFGNIKRTVLVKSKVNAVILSGLLIACSAGLAGCEDFLGDNVNPDKSEDVTIDLVMPTALFYSVVQDYDHAEYGAYLGQCLTTGGRSQTGSYAHRSGWEFLGMTRHPQWRRHFFDVGTNLNVLLEKAEEENSVNYQALGGLLRLMSNQKTTDAFGDIPLSEAYGTTGAPKYDSQEDIYKWMHQEVDRLSTLFDGEDINKPDNRAMNSRVDRVFAGDMAKWRQVLYGVKARLLLRNLPNMNTDEATCNAIIAAAEEALNGWSDPMYQFDGGSSVEQNCMWGRTNKGVNGWESWNNNLIQAMPTAYFIEDVMGYDIANDTCPDPRLPYMMKKRADKSGKAVYRYLEANYGMPATHNVEFYPDLHESVLTTDQSAICLLTEAELHFIIAEAAYWAGNKAKAHSHLIEGIQYHMNRLGVPAESINAYVTNAELVPGSSNITLTDIMREKYKAMYLQPELWNDLRRYGYSNSDNGVVYSPLGEPETVYPGLRRPYNLYEAYWAEDNDWIQRINYDPETEEKYNRGELERLGAFRNPEWLKKPMIWGRSSK